MFYVILLFALFASLFTFSKAALETAQPFFLVGSRMLLAGCILVTYQAVFHTQAFKKVAKAFVPLFFLGLLNIYICNAAEIWGLTHMSSAKTCLLYSLSPFVSALIAYFVLGETLNKKKWIAMIVGFVGLAPILATTSQDEGALAQLLFISAAEIAVIIAVIASAYGWILLKKIVNQYNMSPLSANGLSMILGGALTLVHSYLSGENYAPLPITAHMGWEFVQFLVIMTLISNIVCYNLYGFLLKRFSATFMSLAGLVTPLFASLFGWVFLNETITWHYFASIMVFSVGLALFYQEELASLSAKTQA